MMVSRARVHYALGRTLAFWGWPGGAAQAFADAIRCAPAFLDAHRRRGMALLAAGRAGEAGEVFARVAAAQPHDPEALGDVVVAWSRAGRLDRADEALHRLIALRPGQPELHVLRGALLRKQHRAQESIRTFRCAVALGPLPPGPFVLGEAVLGEKGWRAILTSHLLAMGVEAAGPAVAGHSALHVPPRARHVPPSRMPGRLARLVARWRSTAIDRGHPRVESVPIRAR